MNRLQVGPTTDRLQYAAIVWYRRRHFLFCYFFCYKVLIDFYEW